MNTLSWHCGPFRHVCVHHVSVIFRLCSDMKSKSVSACVMTSFFIYGKACSILTSILRYWSWLSEQRIKPILAVLPIRGERELYWMLKSGLAGTTTSIVKVWYKMCWVTGVIDTLYKAELCVCNSCEDMDNGEVCCSPGAFLATFVVSGKNVWSGFGTSGWWDCIGLGAWVSVGYCRGYWRAAWTFEYSDV